MDDPKDIKNERIEEFRQRFSGGPPARRDPAAIERRRKHVWEMALEGIPQTAMADILKVTRQTVSSDIDYIKKSEQTKVHGMKNDSLLAELDIGVTARKLESIAEACMQEYMAAGTAQDKHRFLDAAAKTIVNRHRVLMETGMLPKAGIEVKTTVDHSISFEDRFGKDSKWKIMDNAVTRRRILSVAEAALKLGLKTEFDKPIDATAKVVDSNPAAAPVEQPKPNT